MGRVGAWVGRVGDLGVLLGSRWPTRSTATAINHRAADETSVHGLRRRCFPVATAEPPRRAIRPCSRTPQLHCPHTTHLPDQPDVTKDRPHDLVAPWVGCIVALGPARRRKRVHPVPRRAPSASVRACGVPSACRRPPCRREQEGSSPKRPNPSCLVEVLLSVEARAEQMRWGVIF